MRLFILAIILIGSVFTASAAPQSYHAGVVRLTVPDAPAPFDTVVFYPSDTQEVAWKAGPFTIAASLNTPVAEGQRFPVVLISHGHRGAPFSHRDLATRLARDGCIVSLPTHIGDASGHPEAATPDQILEDRPRQAKEALDTALADPRFAQHADTARIGMIGYSAGGYTALILAGAQPNFTYADTYCRSHDDVASCARHAAGNAGPPVDLISRQPPVEPRLKALVLMDPLAVMFDAAGLASVHIPTLLYRPDDDTYLNALHNALAVAAGLPNPSQQVVVPGSHFVFVDPCPDAIADEASLICKDATGVDRVFVHRKMESEISAFLHAHL